MCKPYIQTLLAEAAVAVVLSVSKSHQKENRTGSDVKWNAMRRNIYQYQAQFCTKTATQHSIITIQLIHQ